MTTTCCTFCGPVSVPAVSITDSCSFFNSSSLTLKDCISGPVNTSSMEGISSCFAAILLWECVGVLDLLVPGLFLPEGFSLEAKRDAMSHTVTLQSAGYCGDGKWAWSTYKGWG